MVPVAGKPCLERVMHAIGESGLVGGGIICGPSAAALERSEELGNLLQHGIDQGRVGQARNIFHAGIAQRIEQ